MSNDSHDSDDPHQRPHESGLPDDAERIGLTPPTAPGLQFAGALRPGRKRDRALALIALVLIVAVVVVALLSTIGG